MTKAASPSTCCPVCRAADLEAILDRGAVPVFQNALYRTPQSARAAARGTLAVRRCRTCGFITNAAFEPDCIVYGPDYDSSQLNSATFQAHLADRLARIAATLPAAGDRPLEIVEVGCGQGDFLIDLARVVGGNRPIRAFGFDPAFRRGRPLPAGLTIEPAYFDTAACRRLGLSPDIVVSRHTIEHIADPVGFLASMRDGLARDAPVHLFLETPDSRWILAHEAFHDFFYEHCSLFDFRSMATALRRAGFDPSRIESCFGGQYLWAEAETGRGGTTTEDLDTRLASYVVRWRQLIDSHDGQVVIWGAGGKGATFALLVDPDAQRIAAVVDKNPGKQGGFLPLTAHPIVAPAQLARQPIDLLLVVNPNYEAEIRTEVARLGLSPRIIVVD